MSKIRSAPENHFAYNRRRGIMIAPSINFEKI
jgi:hypothetical protein